MLHNVQHLCISNCLLAKISDESFIRETFDFKLCLRCHQTQSRSLSQVLICVGLSCCVWRRLQNTHLPVQDLGPDFWARFHFGSSSPQGLMRTDTNGDDNEISADQLLMRSLACQLQAEALGAVYTMQLSAGVWPVSYRKPGKHHSSTSVLKIKYVAEFFTLKRKDAENLWLASVLTLDHCFLFLLLVPQSYCWYKVSMELLVVLLV